MNKVSRYLIATIILLSCTTFPSFSCSGEVLLADIDSDGDGLYDAIERALGSDPNHFDSDGDGLSDSHEAFYLHNGSTVLHINQLQQEHLYDGDGDGIKAISDNDDNGNGVPDGAEDLDNDGIPNAWEHYGFGIDPTTGELIPLFDDSTDPPTTYDPAQDNYQRVYFFTDPANPSTDNDPYSDYMEVMGVDSQGNPMDPAVKQPGGHPRVPAYPDFAIELSSYTITPQATITSTTGGSQSNSWTNSVDTIDKTVTTDQHDVDTGISTKGFSFSAHANYHYTNKVEHTHSTEITDSQSGFKESDWSTATTTNTVQAGTLALQFNVENTGTATAMNVQPTLNVIVGGETLLTYTPADTIDLLSSAQTYPAGSGWVVPQAGGSNVWLTLDGIKNIETAGDIDVEIAQVSANVKSTGDDWNVYLDSIKASSAHVMFDLGDGVVHDYYVFCPTHRWGVKTVRDTTVLDAIRLASGGTVMVDGDNLKLDVPGGPAPQPTDFDGWYFFFDEDTYNNQIAGQQEVDIPSLALTPGAELLVKAPPQGDLVDPQIHWGSYDHTSHTVTAYVTDYLQLASVEFDTDTTGSGSTTAAMQQQSGDIAGGIYTYVLPSNYVASGNEAIIATNSAGNTSQETLSLPRLTRVAHHGQKWEDFCYGDYDKTWCADQAPVSWSVDLDSGLSGSGQTDLLFNLTTKNLKITVPDGSAARMYYFGTGAKHPSAGSVVAASYDLTSYTYGNDGWQGNYKTYGIKTDTGRYVVLQVTNYGYEDDFSDEDWQSVGYESWVYELP